MTIQPIEEGFLRGLTGAKPGETIDQARERMIAEFAADLAESEQELKREEPGE